MARQQRQAQAEVPHGREKVIDAALHLFATKGYGNTSTKSISTHAGVATGLLFYYFDSKSDLLEAVLAERSLAPRVEQLGHELPPDATDALHEVGHELVALARANVPYLTVMLGAAGHVPDALDRLHTALDGLTGRLAARLAKTTGGSAARSKATARAFVGSLVAAVLLLPGTGSDRSLVRTQTVAVLEGLSARQTVGG